MAQARLNLRNVTTILVDRDHFTRGIVAQMLRGFGMDSPTICETGLQAKHHLKHNCVDLVVIEGALPDMASADLVRWIRRQDKSPFRFVPVIVMSGYTQLRHVAAARDAGANLVVKKPFSPAALFDRITWLSRNERPFIETGDFTGPDRRFREAPPRDGVLKRDTDNQTPDEEDDDIAAQQSINSAA